MFTDLQNINHILMIRTDGICEMAKQAMQQFMSYNIH